MNSEKTDTTQVPPLPPSPLAQPVEGPPDVPLPWTTLPLAVMAGLIAGVAHCGAIIAARGGPRLPLSAPAYHGGVDAAHALLVVLGATIADRLVPSWPRGARWACGMGLAALAGVGLLAGVAHLLAGPGAGSAIWGVVDVLGSTAVSYALLGALLGLVSGSTRGLLWRLPVVGFTAMAALLAVRFGLLGLIGVGLFIVGPPASMAGPVLGLLLGFVIAERLNAARRRAVRGRVPEP